MKPYEGHIATWAVYRDGDEWVAATVYMSNPEPANLEIEWRGPSKEEARLWLPNYLKCIPLTEDCELWVRDDNRPDAA